jgi:kinesin family protein 6/9
MEDLPKVKMLEDEHGNFHLKNLSMHAANTEEDALNLLFMGDTNRAIAETPMNMASSRSHCIFSIFMESRDLGSDKVRRAKLNLVDLAGSERVGKTNASGSVLKEAKYINSSLFFLERVIVALSEKGSGERTHIPYRDSMMTSVLRDSLGGNCKTIMIATISPDAVHTDESLSTCRFAQRVSLIKNKATVNEDLDPSMVIKRLKAELLALREEIAFLKGETGEGDALTPMEIEELHKQCREYCENQDPYASLNIGSLTLTKIKDVFAIFKNLVIEARRNGAGQVIDSNAQVSDEAAQKQIKELRSCLLQRDQEIAILVNMVKAGKTVGDVQGRHVNNSYDDSAAQSPNGGLQYGAGASNDRLGGVSRYGENKEDLASMERASKEARAKQFAQQQRADREAELQRERADKMLKRHLFNVPPPTDQTIFEDCAKSFEWFRERCSLNKSMEENRDILKQKIDEAKTAGERANQSRNTISYLKNSIEAIRRERYV